jgi:ABC-type glycerol-3-phosphate transport system substrate-binding protein
MFKQRLLLLAMVAAAGGNAAAATVPMAFARADDGASDAGSLTLVSAGPEVPYTALGPDGYVGFQPLFTEWQQYQPTNVEVAGSTVGSYDVFRV